MCCSFKFHTSFWGSPSKAGDLAVITKKKPQGLGGAVREMFTDADTYTIEFNAAAADKITPAQVCKPFKSRSHVRTLHLARL